MAGVTEVKRWAPAWGSCRVTQRRIMLPCFLVAGVADVVGAGVGLEVERAELT
ncbi:hypothetical protein [Streptomyces altiplanensis]